MQNREKTEGVAVGRSQGNAEVALGAHVGEQRILRKQVRDVVGIEAHTLSKNVGARRAREIILEIGLQRAVRPGRERPRPVRMRGVEIAEEDPPDAQGLRQGAHDAVEEGLPHQLGAIDQPAPRLVDALSGGNVPGDLGGCDHLPAFVLYRGDGQ